MAKTKEEEATEATEIGLQILSRYVPPGTDLNNPPAAVTAVATEIGYSVIGRYDNPLTEEIEGPTGIEPEAPPVDSEPFNLEAKIREALDALPLPTPPPTFMELQKRMQDEMAAQTAPLTPEQQAAHDLDQARYIPPPPPPTMAEQVAAMHLEAPVLTPEQQAEEAAKAERYVPPPPPPTYAELKTQVDAQLEAQRQEELAKLFGAMSSPPP